MLEDVRLSTDKIEMDFVYQQKNPCGSYNSH